MKLIIGISLALFSTVLMGCNYWPMHGEGGMAEHTDRLPNCREVHAGSAYGALDQRLACANRRFDTLKRVGVQLHQPALSEQARLQSQRAWRQLVGGQADDAEFDLVIYAALLDEIERRQVSQVALAETVPAVMASAVTEPEDVIGHVLFVSGSDQINPADLDALRLMVAVLKDEPKTRLTLTGYTDERGDETQNLSLALRRARNVRLAMVELGIAQQRLFIQARGELDPVYANTDRAARLANRRVDIHRYDAIVIMAGAGF